MRTWCGAGQCCGIFTVFNHGVSGEAEVSERAAGWTWAAEAVGGARLLWGRISQSGSLPFTEALEPQ